MQTASIIAATDGAHQGAVQRYIQVDRLSKRYGAVTVLDEVSFDIRQGEFICFLGPSGCGKTTLLMCLAGLEQASAGMVYRHGAPFLTLPPSQRDVGIVFQSYALFPNLTVAENIRFGVENLRKPKAEIRKITDELIALLSLAGHERKYPSQLSGGQQQRVALARALATSPGLLLLDEPLSALDAQVRVRLRGELRDLQARLGITTIMVTHDQEEAQSLADRIVLMNHGRIEQIGSPWDIYNQPQTRFVADFIGVANLFDGRVTAPGIAEADDLPLRGMAGAISPGSKTCLMVRPEDIAVSAHQDAQSQFSATIRKIEYLGATMRLYLTTEAGLPLVADLRKQQASDAPQQPGATAWLAIAPDAVKVLP